MKRTPHLLLPLLVVLVLAAPSSSPGQVTTALDRLEIAFWPEYDQPALLVMLRGWLPADEHLPTYVPIPIPAGVTPSAVAKRDPSGQLLLVAYTLIDHRFYQEIRIVADTREIRVEYYVPLEIEGSKRRYRFEWPGGLALGSVAYEVQQPVGSTALTVSPPPQAQRAGFDGLTYMAADLGSASADQPLEIELGYEKESAELTLASIQPAPSTSPPSTSPPSPSPGTSPPASDSQSEVVVPDAGRFPWLVVLPVVLIAALIVVWFMQSGSDQ